MKGQGRNDDATERSKNGPGKFIASKVRASIAPTSQIAVNASLLSNAHATTQSHLANTSNAIAPVSAIGLSDTSKLSEKEIQV